MTRSFPRRFIFFAFGCSGAAALLFEVTWTRSLSTVMGSSTYALSTMLAAFMAGLSVGGIAGARLAVRSRNPALVFALCELGIGVLGFTINPIIRSLTPVYISTFYAFHLSFGGFSIVQFALAFALMGAPTTLMGITFPVAVSLFADGGQQEGNHCGKLYSVNTLGGIFGSLAGGFLLIPLLGSTRAAGVGAALNVANALVVLLLLKEFRKVFAATALAVVVAASVLAFHPSRVPFFSYYSAARFGTESVARNVLDYVSREGDRIVLFEREGVEGEVCLTDLAVGGVHERTLINGGKLEAGDNLSFELLAYLPYVTHARIEPVHSALSIGLGSGHTLSRLAQLPIDWIFSAELSDGVLEANRRFLHPELFADRRIRHVQADGRNFLLLDPRRYDLIVVSPSWAVELASAGLLTDEFFGLAASRLERTGVFAIWVDFAMMDRKDMSLLLRTFAKSFAHVTAWRLRGDNVILVGANFASYPDEAEVAREVDRLQPLARGGFEAAITALTPRPGSFEDLNTDDRPVIEFHNARNMILGSVAAP